jgi:hypothetical protein
MIMWLRTGLLAVSLLFMLSAENSVAEDDDRAEILTLMDQAFFAVGSGNPDDARATQLAQGTVISFRQHPDGKPGELLMQMTTNEALLADDIDSDDKFVERWTGEPTVMVHGPIAVVWGEYEFWVKGNFSHCGVDAVDLVKIDGDWKIANWMWTVEKDGCSTNPSVATE